MEKRRGKKTPRARPSTVLLYTFEYKTANGPPSQLSPLVKMFNPSHITFSTFTYLFVLSLLPFFLWIDYAS